MNDLILALVLSTLLAAVAGVQKALTTKGILLAWVSAVVITYCGGVAAFAVLAATFLFTVAAGALGKNHREFEKQIHAKTGTRDALQVFCNVGLGAVLLLVGWLLEDARFSLAYAAVMAASLADSLASELGILSKAAPVDICTLKRTQRGLSGGVSLLGLGSSFLGAALIAVVYSLARGWSGFWFITLCGFAGALVDSICGSLLQVKYRCQTCGLITERVQHCLQPTVRVKGFSKITNDAVNLICNIFVGVLSVILLFFL